MPTPMPDYDDRTLRSQAEAGVIDAGLRAYMLRVYNYMLVGLVLTGLTAYSVYSAAATNDPAMAVAKLKNGVMLTSFGVTLYSTPLQWVFMLAPLGAVIYINARMRRMSVGGAQSAFWIFAGLMGVSFSTIFVMYAASSIAQVFFITAAAFGGLSLYGYTTKRDLSAIGSFLIMGVWGLIIAMVVNWFLMSPMIMWIMSVAGVGIFAGLTAYDTQRIKEMYYVGDDGALAAKKSIMGALALYLDFINMFQFLLYLMGGRR
jgi:FtsH-binding integral membrane protein